MEKSIKSRNPTGKEIMKRTKWFDGSKFIPAHEGNYERFYSFIGHYYISYFDGNNWCSFKGAKIGVHYQNLPWRGLKDKSCKK